MKQVFLTFAAIVFLASALGAEPKKQVDITDEAVGAIGDLVEIVKIQQKEISILMDKVDSLDARVTGLEKPQGTLSQYRINFEHRKMVDITKGAW